MSSPELYSRIHSSNFERIRSGQVEIDKILASGLPDLRSGISLIIPVRGMRKEYAAIVERMERAAPDQYYYPFEDLHVTVFDFLQASGSYSRNADLESAFLWISREAAASAGSFPIKMKGLVFSQAAGLIKGYDDDVLIGLRKRIRDGMAACGMANDERYESESAHVTFMRFMGILADPGSLCGALKELEEFDLGAEKVTELELVEHDWYNTRVTKRVIGTVGLVTAG